MTKGLLHAAIGLPVLLLSIALHSAFNIWSYAQGGEVACEARVIVVMGAAQYHGQPSPAFRRRLDRAFELYQQGCGQRILITGGKQEGDTYTEGETGKRYLAALGVPLQHLLWEGRSQTSYENLRFGRALLIEDEILIVTDDIHAYRSLWLAHHIGFEANVAVVATRSARLPYALREFTALMAYHLGWIR